MNVLTKEEFHLLAGTDLLVNMFRNRLQLTANQQELTFLSNYLEENATGFYYVNLIPTNIGTYKLVVHFEKPQDLSRVEQMLYIQKDEEK